jgi:glycosyltransferase involved in cell wall biosynthesis
MAEATSAQIFKQYRKRFNYFGEYQIEETPDKDVKYRIVIPCFNEPNLTATLKSLLQCEVPSVKIEVIVVLNQSSDANEAITSQNLKTLEEFSVWNKRDHSAIEFFIIKALDLPPKKAGVGLARKIGMDESLRRFGEQDKIGHIICLDADCLVSTNYLKSIEKYLTLDVRGGHFYFEHEFLNIENQQLREGIVNYELHLRYYAQALKYAGFSKWHHTVGSCMIVRSDIYAKQGGMNQRKAGEDFYFMHKILGVDCINVPEAIVSPPPKISDFFRLGTGKQKGLGVTNKNTTILS